MPEKKEYNTNRLKIYTLEIQHYERSKYVKKYVNAGRIRAPNSGLAYQNRLGRFTQFIYQRMDMREVDNVIADLQSGKQITIYPHYDAGKIEPELIDLFDMFNHFLTFLRERKIPTKLSANVINAMIRTTKKFLKFSKVKIDGEEFQDRVQLLRKEKPSKKGIEKADAVKLLNACKNIRLKTALYGFAAKGPRPIELRAVCNQDVDLDSKNSKNHI